MADFDPSTVRVTTRPVEIDGKRFTRANTSAIPTWVLAPDRRHAYLILMNDPTLLEIDLLGDGSTVRGVSRGRMIEGKHPDSRCALSVAPDGKVYALVRVDNETGFGTGYLHHLRHDPATGANEDLGILTVKNPDYSDFAMPGPDGKPVKIDALRRCAIDKRRDPVGRNTAKLVGKIGSANSAAPPRSCRR